MDDKINIIRNSIPKAAGAAALAPRLAKLLLALFRDQRVPRYLKILTAGAVAYAGLPFDFLPDFVPVAGALDDILVIVLILVQFMKSCPPDVFLEHWNCVMGENFDAEGDASKALNELDPLVGSKFSMVKDWILAYSAKLSSLTSPTTPETPDDLKDA